MDFDYLKSFFFDTDATKTTTPDSASGDVENQNIPAERLSDPNNGNASTVAESSSEQKEERGSREKNSKLTVSFARSVSNIAQRIRSMGANAEAGIIVHSISGDSSKEDKEEANSGTETESNSSLSDEPPAEREERGRSKRRDEPSRRRRSEMVTRASLDRLEEDKHIALFTHGRVWTCVGIFCTWLGFALAYLARESTSFVTLETPMYVDPVFEEVTEVGMINLRLCFNETRVDMTGCTTHELTTEDVNDRMFQVSRSVAFVAILLGGFMSVFLTAAVFWHSINLRPVGVGYLLSYFLQSFSFLFFDSTLCAEQSCRISSGGYYSIIASGCWIFACVAASRMDAFKYSQKRLRVLRERQRRSLSRSHSPSKKPRKRPIGRGVSDVTGVTAGTDGSSDQDFDCQRNVGTSSREFVAIHGIQDIEAAEAWVARASRIRDARVLEPLTISVEDEEVGYERALTPRTPRGQISPPGQVAPTSSPRRAPGSLRSDGSLTSVDRSMKSTHSRTSHRSRSRSRTPRHSTPTAQELFPSPPCSPSNHSRRSNSSARPSRSTTRVSTTSARERSQSATRSHSQTRLVVSPSAASMTSRVTHGSTHSRRSRALSPSAASMTSRATHDSTHGSTHSRRSRALSPSAASMSSRVTHGSTHSRRSRALSPSAASMSSRVTHGSTHSRRSRALSPSAASMSSRVTHGSTHSRRSRALSPSAASMSSRVTHGSTHSKTRAQVSPSAASLGPRSTRGSAHSRRSHSQTRSMHPRGVDPPTR